MRPLVDKSGVVYGKKVYVALWNTDQRLLVEKSVVVYSTEGSRQGCTRSY